MKKILVTLALLGLLLPGAGSVLAEEDGPITVDGITFESVIEYFNSDYFRENGKRCGTVVDPATLEVELGDIFERGTPADCGIINNPDDEYLPTIVWEIPVVVHILHHTNGTGDISDETVRSQIVVLNEDFQAIPGTPGEPGYNTMVQFALATEDPDGNPTDGITRTANSDWYNDNGVYWSLSWDPDRYLNIYTNNPGGGILGYVPFLPYQGNSGSAQDRVVIWYRCFGDPGQYPPYNLGRTATHEVGHYLGLFHTFQNGCGIADPPQCSTTGDRICDTNSESNYRFGCPTGATSCGSLDPIHNYMDYTDDYCMNNYTEEQGKRIRCTMIHYRPDIYSEYSPSAVDEPGSAAEFARLHGTYPNPFNPKTSVSFSLESSEMVKISVYDMSGRRIAVLVNEEMSAGDHEITWNGTNFNGERMSSGVYLVRLHAGNHKETQSVVLMK